MSTPKHELLQIWLPKSEQVILSVEIIWHGLSQGLNYTLYRGQTIRPPSQVLV